jgi:hypothetical protein
MQCDRLADDTLAADKMDVLYGEADSEVRARVAAHLASCVACRDEMGALAGVRQDLQAWTLPASRRAFTPRGIVVPRWLAAAAVFLVSLGATLGATGYLSLRRALDAQEARAAALEQQQKQAQAALAAALARPSARAAATDTDGLLALVDERVDARVRESEARRQRQLDVRLASFNEQVETQRRLDLAKVAAGLSYLDGRHGQQLARTNELMGYVLQASEKR